MKHMRRELMQQLLDAIDDVPRGRAELLERSGLSVLDWQRTVNSLVSCGEVIQYGDRRTAMYVRRGGVVVRPSPTASATPVVAADPRRSKGTRKAVDVLFDTIDEVPRARAELTKRAGIKVDAWASAIWALIQRGDVIKQGDRGTARYSRASKHIEGQDRVATPRPLQSPVRQSVHDDVEDIMRELGVFDEPTIARSTPTPTVDTRQRLLGGRAPGVVATPAIVTPPRSVPTAPAQPGGRAAATGGFRYEAIDKRNVGGCLWIVDSPAARIYVAEANAEGAAFVYAQEGGRATDGRPAWWTK
jgi:hypothetical protein